MIYIKKVLNSSVVLVDKEGQEMIALGKGIGYGKSRRQHSRYPDRSSFSADR